MQRLQKRSVNLKKYTDKKWIVAVILFPGFECKRTIRITVHNPIDKR